MTRAISERPRAAYMREYQREWMAARRAKFFEGKACARCGATEGLELDHVDPTEKVTHCVWSWSEQRRSEELAKCQVLCRRCHKAKTRRQIALLDERLVSEARDRYRAGGISQKSLAAVYGVSENTMHKALTGQTWANVPGAVRQQASYSCDSTLRDVLPGLRDAFESVGDPDFARAILEEPLKALARDLVADPARVLRRRWLRGKRLAELVLEPRPDVDESRRWLSALHLAGLVLARKAQAPRPEGFPAREAGGEDR
ncbi:MAG: HNH endonuclease [Myxococcota bacterium]